MKTMLRPFIPRVLRLCINRNSDFVQSITDKYVILSSGDFPAVDLIFFPEEKENDSSAMLPSITLTENRSVSTYYEEIRQIAINRFTLYTNIFYEIYSRKDEAVTVRNNYKGSDYLNRTDRRHLYYEDIKAAYHRHFAENRISNSIIPDYRNIWNISVNRYHPAEADRLLYYIDHSDESEKKIILNILGLNGRDYERILREAGYLRLEKIRRESLERIKTCENTETAEKLISGFIQSREIRKEFVRESLPGILRDLRRELVRPAGGMNPVYTDSSYPYYRAGDNRITNSYPSVRSSMYGYTLPDYRRIWNISVNQYHPAEADRLLYYIDHSDESEKKIMLDILGFRKDEYRRVLSEIKNLRFEEIRKESLERAGRYDRQEAAAGIPFQLNQIYSEAAGLFYNRAGDTIENYLRMTQMERMQFKTDFLHYIEDSSHSSFVRELIHDIRSDESLAEEARAWISFPTAETEYVRDPEKELINGQDVHTVERRTETSGSSAGETSPAEKTERTDISVRELNQWIQYMPQETWDSMVSLIYKNARKTEKVFSGIFQSDRIKTESGFHYLDYVRDVFHLNHISEKTDMRQCFRDGVPAVRNEYVYSDRSGDVFYRNDIFEQTYPKQDFFSGDRIIRKGDIFPEEGGPVSINSRESISEQAFVYQYPEMVITPPTSASGHLSVNAGSEAALKKAEETVRSVREEITDITRIKKNVTEVSTEVFAETIRRLTEQVDQQHKDIQKIEENQSLIIRNTDTAMLTERVLRNLNRQLYLEKLRKGIR